MESVKNRPKISDSNWRKGKEEIREKRGKEGDQNELQRPRANRCVTELKINKIMARSLLSKGTSERETEGKGLEGKVWVHKRMSRPLAIPLR